MKKLIETHQEYLIVCDNKECDYKINNPTGDPNTDISQYLNQPCPSCGDNLLTEKDYKTMKSTLRIINCLNKWFGWLIVFTNKKTPTQKASIKIHQGIKIKDK